MHECPDCGYACDCDGEDTWWNDYDECACSCWRNPDNDDDDFDDLD